MKADFEKFIAYPNNKIIECLEKIEKNGNGELIIINSYHKLLGSISDGDIRRALLGKNLLKNNIKKIYNKKPIFLNLDKNITELRKIFEKKQINILPLINSKKKVLKIYSKKDLDKSDKDNNNSIVIMAGGKGLRMKPFTNVFPKALLPFKKSTIIEEIINKFYTENFKKIFIPTGFKSQVLTKHLKDEGYKNIVFSKENKPLGTIGGLKNIENELSTTIILTNCDTFIDTNYYDLINFHRKNKNLITIVSGILNQKIDFGVCEIDKRNLVKKIVEKPTEKKLINTGFYVFDKKVFKLIPKNKFYNSTDLINKCIKKKMKIGVYPISIEKWKDVGNWLDYNKNIKI